MKFQVNITEEKALMLKAEYRDYIKNTHMTRPERSALRQWVQDGNSVHDNGSGVSGENGFPMDFVDVYREEEYIRSQTKGMSPEDQHRFAMDFYGWNSDSVPSNENPFLKSGSIEVDEDHPFE